MNGLDIGLLVLLSLLVLLGVLKGLTRILIGIGALVAAFFFASQFHGPVAVWLGGWVDLPEAGRMLGAYLIIFLGTMLAGALIAALARKVLKTAMLSWVDRLAGGALGLVAALLIAALLILPIVAYSPKGDSALQSSVLAPYVAVVADLATRLVPAELSERYRENMEILRRHWRERWSAFAIKA